MQRATAARANFAATCRRLHTRQDLAEPDAEEKAPNFARRESPEKSKKEPILVQMKKSLLQEKDPLLTASFLVSLLEHSAFAKSNMN
jgi:hypothetical protein